MKGRRRCNRILRGGPTTTKATTITNLSSSSSSFKAPLLLLLLLSFRLCFALVVYDFGHKLGGVLEQSSQSRVHHNGVIPGVRRRAVHPATAAAAATVTGAGAVAPTTTVNDNDDSSAEGEHHRITQPENYIAG
jgi:hypothetical protein